MSDAHPLLEAQFDSYDVLSRIHAVPPHEVYEVRVDGRRAVYKRDAGPTGSAATEGRVIALVDRRTPVPVPEVLAVGHGGFVAAWHPDAPAPDDGAVPDRRWARAAGRGLATLHAETDPWIDAYGPFVPPGEGADDAAGDQAGGIGVDGHDDWHAAAVAYVEDHRRPLDRNGHGDVADAVLDYLRGRPDAFEGSGPPVCCHGWATPDHVAVVDGAVACLVDFEHAMAAPAEFDYWRTALPTFEDDATRRAFREGYESVRPLPPDVADRRPLYVLLNGVYYFESLYVQDRHGPAETADRAGDLRELAFDTLADLR